MQSMLQILAKILFAAAVDEGWDGMYLTDQLIN
jgi:hypothetical protein